MSTYEVRVYGDSDVFKKTFDSTAEATQFLARYFAEATLDEKTYTTDADLVLITKM